MAKWCNLYYCWCSDVEDLADGVDGCDYDCNSCDLCEEVKPRF